MLKARHPKWINPIYRRGRGIKVLRMARLSILVEYRLRSFVPWSARILLDAIAGERHFAYRAHDVFTISKISVCTKPTVISSISTGVFFPVNQAVFFVQTFFETYKFAQQIFFGPEN